MDKDLRERTWQRSRGKCEACGLPMDYESWDWSHRKAKGKFKTAGESYFIQNGMAVHHRCHMIDIENHPVLARQKGWRVPSYEDPRAIPIALYGTIWTYLEPDGSYRKVVEPEVVVHYTSLQKEGK